MTKYETYPYRLSYKIPPCERFPDGYSATDECNYATIESVERQIAEIQAGNDSTYIPEMTTAFMWVSDENGNIY